MAIWDELEMASVDLTRCTDVPVRVLRHRRWGYLLIHEKYKMGNRTYPKGGMWTLWDGLHRIAARAYWRGQGKCVPDRWAGSWIAEYRRSRRSS